MALGRKQDASHTAVREDFDQVFRCYYRPLCLYALHHVPDVDVVEDIVQECFIQLWQRLQQGEAVAEPKAYLYTMVHHRCVDALRQDSMIDSRVALEDVDRADEDDAEERSLLEARMWTAIDALPEGCRRVLLCCKRDGMSYEEVAAQLGISVNTVKNQMSKALKLLKGAGDKVYHLFLSVVMA
jgi:RNA polymerase sigma-70 factor (ECF subfamily)